MMISHKILLQCEAGRTGEKADLNDWQIAFC